jgi:hypothetical protein
LERTVGVSASLGVVTRSIGAVPLAAELDKFQEKVESLFGLVSRKMTDVVSTQNDTTRELGRVSGLVSGAKGAGDLGGGSGGLDSLLASLGGGGGGGEDDLGALRKEVAALRKEVRLSKDKDAESVKIGGLQFKTREDLAAYLLEEAPGLPFGTIVDYHALMQQVHYDLGGYESVDSILKGLKLRSDMALETTADVLALASIRRGIPALLGEGKPATGEDRSSFNAFHSFADWKNSNGRDGLVNTLPASQQQAREAIEADIETRLVPGSPGAMLAQTCLAKSVTFSDAFTKYLTTTYEDLTQASGFPKKRAWALTTALGARVCKEIHKESVALARFLTVLLIWAMLRAHSKMDDYVKHEFKDHPTIASEYVKFLATNSGYEAMAGLQTKVDSLEKEVASLKKAVTNAANAADVAKAMAADAKKIAQKK